MVLERESIREIIHNELCASILAIAEIHLEALGKDPQLAPEMALAILQAGGNAMRDYVKLLPLPQPSLRARMDARTNPSAQRATQLRSVLARVYAVSIQNQITTTAP
jgi:hypothetical protein